MNRVKLSIMTTLAAIVLKLIMMTVILTKATVRRLMCDVTSTKKTRQGRHDNILKWGPGSQKMTAKIIQ